MRHKNKWSNQVQISSVLCGNNGLFSLLLSISLSSLFVKSIFESLNHSFVCKLLLFLEFCLDFNLGLCRECFLFLLMLRFFPRRDDLDGADVDDPDDVDDVDDNDGVGDGSDGNFSSSS